MKEQIEYVIVKFLFLVAKLLPKGAIYALSKMLFLVGFMVKKNRRTLVKNNLKIAFPDLLEGQLHTMAKEVYINLSQSVAEILLMFVDRFDIDGAIVNLDEAIKKIEKLISQDRGIIVITAHYSNWELAAQFLARHGLPMLAVGREGDNTLIDQNLTLPFRQKYGNRAVYKSKAMISMAKALKNKQNVGMLIDQKTGGTHASPVEFFGKKANTTLSVASLKLKFDPLVIPISVIRESRGKYRMFIEEPIEYKADEISDEKEKLKSMTLVYNKALEKMILRSPTEWFWMHNRWNIKR